VQAQLRAGIVFFLPDVTLREALAGRATDDPERLDAGRAFSNERNKLLACKLAQVLLDRYSTTVIPVVSLNCSFVHIQRQEWFETFLPESEIQPARTAKGAHYRKRFFMFLHNISSSKFS
jgi:hypothetical protein